MATLWFSLVLKVQIEVLMEFMTTPHILRLPLVFFQHVWVLTPIFLRPTVQTEKLQFAMEKVLMASQTSVAHHPFQCAMAFQEPMVTQVLIAMHHLSQHVAPNTVDNQALIAKSDLALNSPHLQEHQL